MQKDRQDEVYIYTFGSENNIVMLTHCVDVISIACYNCQLCVVLPQYVSMLIHVCQDMDGFVCHCSQAISICADDLIFYMYLITQ